MIKFITEQDSIGTWSVYALRPTTEKVKHMAGASVEVAEAYRDQLEHEALEGKIYIDHKLDDGQKRLTFTRKEFDEAYTWACINGIHRTLDRLFGKKPKT